MDKVTQSGSIEELQKLAITLVEKITDEVFLNRVCISLALAVEQEKGSD